jgi:hypothetical protein
MTGRDRGGDTHGNTHAVVPYDVGYGKPPAQHRFAKGQSGNPGGRPRKTREPAIPKSRGLGFASQPANRILLEEAYRMVTLKENGEVIQLPAIQAVLRATCVAAMKGDRWALRQVVERLQQIESSDQEMRVDYFKTMVEYKVDGSHAIARARAAGSPEPRLVPHPDDIIIEMKTGDTAICGPSTLEDKAAWDDTLAWRDSLQNDISDCAASHDGEQSPHGKAENREKWHRLQAQYDIVNDNLPPRYRKELVDRSFADGATLPGSQKTRKWPGE